MTDNKVQYSYRWCERAGSYEVVRYEGDKSLVVQRGLRDQGKAQAAAVEWRWREAAKSDPKSGTPGGQGVLRRASTRN